MVTKKKCYEVVYDWGGWVNFYRVHASSSKSAKVIAKKELDSRPLYRDSDEDYEIKSCKRVRCVKKIKGRTLRLRMD